MRRSIHIRPRACADFLSTVGQPGSRKSVPHARPDARGCFAASSTINGAAPYLLAAREAVWTPRGTRICAGDCCEKESPCPSRLRMRDLTCPWTAAHLGTVRGRVGMPIKMAPLAVSSARARQNKQDRRRAHAPASAGASQRLLRATLRLEILSTRMLFSQFFHLLIRIALNKKIPHLRRR